MSDALCSLRDLISDRLPEDLDIQFKEIAAEFPVGMRIEFRWTGSAIMPDSINPSTMKGGAPAGEVLEMTPDRCCRITA
jgi:hypothetical protein